MLHDKDDIINQFYHCTLSHDSIPLKTKGCQFDNFVVTGDTVSSRNDNLRCHQRRQSLQIDNLMFSVTEWAHGISSDMWDDESQKQKKISNKSNEGIIW